VVAHIALPARIANSDWFSTARNARMAIAVAAKVAVMVARVIIESVATIRAICVQSERLQNDKRRRPRERRPTVRRTDRLPRYALPCAPVIVFAAIRVRP
jgi:hypothetical protein